MGARGAKADGAHLAKSWRRENFPEGKFQRAVDGALRSLASDQPMCVRKPPKVEEEPPERTG